jgi:hypothetical protein
MSRENSTSKASYFFRPYYVNRALRWLKLNNPLYKDISFVPLIEEDTNQEHVVFLENTVELSETEDATLTKYIENKLKNSSSINLSAESDIQLLYTDDPVPSKEDYIKELMGKTARTIPKMFVIPSIKKTAHPKDHEDFYEKTAPHLYPYGRGGLHDCHKLKEEDYFKLLLSRGGDRRFQRDPRFYYTVYCYRMRKRVGGISKLATDGDTHSQQINNIVDDVNHAGEAEHMVAVLEEDDHKAIKKLFAKTVPYSQRIPGTAPYMKMQRKQLFSMLSSPAVTSAGNLRVFGTNSPCDLYNAEFFTIVADCTQKEVMAMTIAERQIYLREYPAVACRQFQARLDCMFDCIYMGTAMPFNDITDFWIRIEFQGFLFSFLFSSFFFFFNF